MCRSRSAARPAHNQGTTVDSAANCMVIDSRARCPMTAVSGAGTMALLQCWQATTRRSQLGSMIASMCETETSKSITLVGIRRPARTCHANFPRRFAYLLRLNISSVHLQIRTELQLAHLTCNHFGVGKLLCNQTLVSTQTQQRRDTLSPYRHALPSGTGRLTPRKGRCGDMGSTAMAPRTVPEVHYGALEREGQMAPHRKAALAWS